MGDREKAEQILWNYRKNWKKVKELREVEKNLMSVQGQDYGAHTVNVVSDPVLEVAHRKIELNTYQMWCILRKRYIEHKRADIVMRELGITKATYYRRKNELIERAEEYV